MLSFFRIANADIQGFQIANSEEQGPFGMYCLISLLACSTSGVSASSPSLGIGSEAFASCCGLWQEAKASSKNQTMEKRHAFMDAKLGKIR